MSLRIEGMPKKLIKKDRLTIFSEQLVGDLRNMMLDKELESYLFLSNQGDGNRPLHTRTVQKIFQKLMQVTKIHKKATRKPKLSPR